MIGSRLRSARAASGLSLRDLALKIETLVTPQAIGKYERDEDMPSSRVLLALSGALSVSVDYLLSDGNLALEGLEFRKKTGSAKEEATIEARTIQALERYLTVEEVLDLRSVDWEKPRNAPYPTHDPRDAEDVARSVRDEWGLGNDPVPRLAELLEERGVKVVSLDLENIDGLAAKVTRGNREAARVIVIKRSAWSERKRFSLAHELGHMCMKMVGDADSEAAANRFAGAFLMPADALRAEIGAVRSSISFGELAAIKRRYGASLQAIAYRCKDLDIISKATFSVLFREFKARGWRDEPFREPECMPPEYEQPKRFERLCYRALSEGIIAESRAAELLGISSKELEAALNQVGADSARSDIRKHAADGSP